jgi:uncharacterized protein YdaU (DUF1376 family)
VHALRAGGGGSLACDAASRREGEAGGMTKANTWMPLYIGDYLADTMRLSTLQHGAYLLLLMEYWRSGPLPDNDEQLAAIAKMDLRAWRAQAAAVRRFFLRGEDGLLHQKRADAELAKAGALIDKRRSALRMARTARAARVREGRADDGCGAATAAGGADASAGGGARASADAGTDARTHDSTHVRAHPGDLDSSTRACRATVTVTNYSVPSERRDGVAPVHDARDEFWREGLAAFRRLTGKTEGASRMFLGRWLRDLRDDCAAGMALIRKAETDRPGDPAAWLAAAAQRQGGTRAGPRDEHPFSHAAQMRGVAEIFNIVTTERDI